MAAPEVYTALERGVLDGVYGFDFITAVAYKLHEIAPHFTDIGDGPHAPAATVINIDTWQSFPAGIQAACNEIVDEIYGGQYSSIMNKVLHDYVQKARKEGVKFHVLDDAQKKTAKALIQPAQVNKWSETVAKPAGIDAARMQALIDQAIAKHDPKGTLLRPSEIAAQA